MRYCIRKVINTIDGRLSSETINKFRNGEQLNVYYYYDNMGRLEKTISDNISEVITQKRN
jgi:hypothetical protein